MVDREDRLIAPNKKTDALLERPGEPRRYADEPPHDGSIADPARERNRN